jgi:hypothetical protein
MRPLRLAALLLLAPSSAFAEGVQVPPVRDTMVLKECGSCHMAFPPALLPAASWDRIMNGLADHFGEDASLPADKAAAVRAYLTANAGTLRPYMRWVAPEGAPLRITDNPAFRREHHFAPRIWADPKVVTRSNCPACHTAAEKGLFEEN